MSLTDVPTNFSIDSEEEVRFAVARFFHEIGFNLDELSFEDHFTIQLGRSSLASINDYKNRNNIQQSNVQQRRQAHGYSDLLLSRNDKPIAIVEVKHLDHELNSEDAWQAISYARLLKRQIAPFAIVTNGRNTKVYDPLADSDDLVELISPINSTWHKAGQSFTAIGEELKSFAAKKLISCNGDTLYQLCKKQVTESISDLKSSNGIYIPETYVERLSTSKDFDTWLSTNTSCFALIGSSGMGKTNFLCKTAEVLVEQNFVLFYSAKELYAGLIQAIVNDFTWEFRRETNISQILERFYDLSVKHDKKFIIFIDALDEFVGEQTALKAELKEFIRHIDGDVLRLCTTCKPFDWEKYVIDDGQRYNLIAKNIYPKIQKVQAPQPFDRPDATKVGVHLSTFSEEELNNAFELYKNHFTIIGELVGNTRKECETPLILRLAAEVYGGNHTELPEDINSKELFDSYWHRMMHKTSDPIKAEQILSILSEQLIQVGVRQINLTALQKNLNWDQITDDAYKDVVRLGLLQVAYDSSGVRSLSFNIENLRNYVYAVHARNWHSKIAQEVAKEIYEALKTAPNNLLIDAMDFYFTSVERGDKSTLTEIALLDLGLFIEIVDDFPNPSALKSSIVSRPDNQRFKILQDRLGELVSAYARIFKLHFPELYKRVPPFNTGEIGIWFDGNNIHQWRTRTENHPQLVLLVGPETAGNLWSGNVSKQLYQDIKPFGPIYGGTTEIEKELPSKLAWKKITQQIINLFANQLLDESLAIEVINERIHDSFIHESHIFRDGDIIDFQNLYELLGFSVSEQFHEETIETLLNRMSIFESKFYAELQNDNKKGSTESDFKLISHLFVLRYWLCLVKDHQNYIPKPQFKTETIFQQSIRNPQGCVNIIEHLLPTIVKEASLIIEKNFSTIKDKFALYRFQDANILIEVTHSNETPFSSDYVELRYVILPSAKLPKKYFVYSQKHSQSLAKEPLKHSTLRGSFIQSFGGRYGIASLDIVVEGLEIKEPNAHIYVTKFPNRQPILDQIYQLISGEAEFLLGRVSRNWHNTEHSRIDYGSLVQILIETSSSKE